MEEDGRENVKRRLDFGKGYFDQAHKSCETYTIIFVNL